MGCGGGGPAIVPAPAPPRLAAPVEQAPAEPSAFEQRWASACSESSAVGRCPAPFDRPGVFIDLADDEAGAPPFCGALEPSEAAAVRDALAAKRKALKACFRGAPHGTFVDLGPGATIAPHARGVARTEACVAKLVSRALQGLPGAQPERVVVALSAVAQPDAEALSKASLDSVTAAHAADVSACYDAALEVWPGLQGRIASMIVIWFDGSVALVRTSQSTLENPALECCINTAIRGWPFPRPSDGRIALVTFPFTLGKRR